MRLSLLCCVLLAAQPAATASPQPRPRSQPRPRWQNGDVVLQTSASTQSKAIQLASGSPLSHAGMVEVARDGVFVIEAIGRVSRTPVEAWIRRGHGGRYLALRRADLTPEQGARVVEEARRFLGKRYDALFEWSDDRIYCTELVAKAFRRGAGLEVGRMQRIGELNLAPVLAAARERYGGKVPLDREVLTPASLGADRSFSVLHDDFPPAN